MDAQSSIAAARAVGHPREGQVTALGHSKMDLEARVAPCTRHGLSPAELPGPVEGLVLVPLALASAPVLASVRRVPEQVAQVA